MGWPEGPRSLGQDRTAPSAQSHHIVLLLYPCLVLRAAPPRSRGSSPAACPLTSPGTEACTYP
eukprot:1573467-Pyramimonas_sp.AAC.1